MDSVYCRDMWRTLTKKEHLLHEKNYEETDETVHTANFDGIALKKLNDVAVEKILRYLPFWAKDHLAASY